jgi:ribosome-binding protein aMBF1 (putative translation factor)
MNPNRIYTFEQHLNESLQDPEFRKVWEESEPEWHLSRQIIEARLAQKLSQRDLAKKAKTTQAIVSRVESGSANTSISTIKRFSKALNIPITIHIPA